MANAAVCKTVTRGFESLPCLSFFINNARVLELVYRHGLKPCGVSPCGFESHPGHKQM